jgi:putative phage-type endonuclease
LSVTERIRYKNRAEWLAGRDRGIGASEASAATGLSRRMTALDLWKIKTGQKEAPDLSALDYVQRGVRMEGAVRGFFAASHPELKVYHHPYDILFQTERPWLFATLDGETADRETGEQGIIEIKNVQPRNRDEWIKWESAVPDEYYDQILHQHLATKRNKIWLIAALYHMDGDVTLREFFFDFAANEGLRLDAEWVLEKETIMWDCIVNRRLPMMAI